MIDLIWAFITSYYWWGFAISIVILSFLSGLLQDKINSSGPGADVPLWVFCLISAIGSFIWPFIGIILLGMLPAFIGKAISNGSKKIKNAKKTEIKNLI
jgi:hypothetical protein